MCCAALRRGKLTSIGGVRIMRRRLLRACGSQVDSVLQVDLRVRNEKGLHLRSRKGVGGHDPPPTWRLSHMRLSEATPPSISHQKRPFGPVLGIFRLIISLSVILRYLKHARPSSCFLSPCIAAQKRTIFDRLTPWLGSTLVLQPQLHCLSEAWSRAGQVN